MCLAVPAKLMERRGDEGIVDLHGTRVGVNLTLVPDATIADWLLIHAGFAIQRLDAQEAAETWALLDEVADSASDLSDTSTREPI